MTSSQIEVLKDQIIEHVMNNDPDYEAEYDHRMERWCFYCGAYDKPREGLTHEADCVWMKGQILKGLEK